jgi:hypothetical protein
VAVAVFAAAVEIAWAVGAARDPSRSSRIPGLKRLSQALDVKPPSQRSVAGHRERQLWCDVCGKGKDGAFTTRIPPQRWHHGKPMRDYIDDPPPHR